MIKFDHEFVPTLARSDADGTDVDPAEVNGADTDGWSADDAFPGGVEARAWIAPRASGHSLANVSALSGRGNRSTSDRATTAAAAQRT